MTDSQMKILLYFSECERTLRDIVGEIVRTPEMRTQHIEDTAWSMAYLAGIHIAATMGLTDKDPNMPTYSQLAGAAIAAIKTTIENHKLRN